MYNSNPYTAELRYHSEQLNLSLVPTSTGRNTPEASKLLHVGLEVQRVVWRGANSNGLCLVIISSFKQ